MFGISALIQSFLACVSQIVQCSRVKVENQETTTIIEDKENLEKAGDIAERIIEITQK